VYVVRVLPFPLFSFAEVVEAVVEVAPEDVLEETTGLPPDALDR